MQELLNSQGRGGPSGAVPGMSLNDQAAAAAQLEEGNVDIEEDNMGVAETYAEYMPSKLKIGRKHPDPVVETASMSSVPPPDVWYKVSISKFNTLPEDSS